MKEKLDIISPMARGNGAYVLHRMIQDHIEGYKVVDYSALWEYFPLAFPFFLYNKTPSIIHTTPDYGIFFRRSGIPHVITVHHLVLDKFMRQYSSLAQKIHYRTDLRLFSRLSIENADAVTAVSEYTAKMVRSEFGFKGPIRVIYNGIDTERFSPCSRDDNRKGVRALFAGNITMRKGANLLPEISKLLIRGIEIVYTCGLRGGGNLPDLQNLKNLGRLSSNDMPALYRSCDILLFPTVREGFGLVAAEAMSCGLPIVATDCSALPELIDEGKGGFLCPLGDIKSFADRINYLAENEIKRKEMGEYNRAKVEEMFTLDRMISQYKELFEEVRAIHS